jgi:hypothetical protein
MFNFEQWLKEHSYWEDPDAVLQFHSTENGGVYITDFECMIEVEGKTLEEACMKFSEEENKRR